MTNNDCCSSLHPIYSFIHDFHLQFQEIVQALRAQDPMLVSGRIYNLLSHILCVVPPDQVINQKKNALKVTNYRRALNDWFNDWFGFWQNGIHKGFAEVLYFFIHF